MLPPFKQSITTPSIPRPMICIAEERTTFSRQTRANAPSRPQYLTADDNQNTNMKPTSSWLNRSIN
jgi:hypothetical protein